MIQSKGSRTSFFSCAHLLNRNDCCRTFFGTFSTAYTFILVYLCINSFWDLYGCHRTYLNAASTGHTVLLLNKCLSFFYLVHYPPPSINEVIIFDPGGISVMSSHSFAEVYFSLFNFETFPMAISFMVFSNGFSGSILIQTFSSCKMATIFTAYFLLRSN